MMLALPYGATNAWEVSLEFATLKMPSVPLDQVACEYRRGPRVKRAGGAKGDGTMKLFLCINPSWLDACLGAALKAQAWKGPLARR